MYSYVLFLGCTLWIVSELLEITNSGFTATTVTLVGLSYILISVGLLSIWKVRDVTMLGKATSACFACGMLLLGLFYLNSFGSNIKDDVDLSSSWFFLFGAVIAFIGIVGLAVWILTESNYPRWTGIAMIINPIISITSITIFPFLMPLQPLSNLLMAVSLGYIALQKITENPVHVDRRTPRSRM